MRRTRWPATLALLVLLLGSLPALAGGARGTRPGGSSASPRSGSSASAGRSTAPATRGGTTAVPRAQAQGTATYGHGYGGVAYGGYWPSWYWAPGIWGYGSWDWGWAAWGWPAWDPWWHWGYGPVYPYAYGRPMLHADRFDRGPTVVETDVRPGRAVLRLDGEEIGRARDFNGTWDRLYLEPGSHILEFEKPGWQTLRVNVEARPGRFYWIDEEMRRGEGVDPRSTPENEVRPPDQAPPDEGPRGFRAEPDNPRPPEAAPEYRGSGQAPAVHRGLLRLDVRPPDAAVYLDGEFLGRAGELAGMHGAVPVAEGTHRIEIVRPGYKSASQEVNVSGGEPARVQVDLERQ